MMIMNNNFEMLDLLGVGIGPFNMSVAALLSPLSEINSMFFDGRPSFIWHAGQLLPEAEVQVSHLKDLVTLVDPTNPYSFLAFLRSQKRLYRFINSNFSNVSRMEFSEYFQWVSQSLPGLSFGESVEEVKFKKSHFVMQTSKRLVRGKNLVLGNGLVANIPSSVKPHLSENVYHIKDFMRANHNFGGKRVVIIGGGQSGAEAFNSIISNSAELPTQLTWVSSREQLAPIDESVFAQEIFTPNFSEHFYGLPAEAKAGIVQQQTLASDGISTKLLEQIYKRLYFMECVEKRPAISRFLTGHKLVEMSALQSGGYQLLLQNCRAGSERLLVAGKGGSNDGEDGRNGDNRVTNTGTGASHTDHRVVNADIVILATGFHWELPSYLEGMIDMVPLDENGQFLVNRDFSVQWDGPSQNRIYVQNGARHTHGVADPNLSLMAWRSATIINSLTERTVYDLAGESCAMNWNDLSPLHAETFDASPRSASVVPMASSPEPANAIPLVAAHQVGKPIPVAGSAQLDGTSRSTQLAAANQLSSSLLLPAKTKSRGTDINQPPYECKSFAFGMKLEGSKIVSSM